MICAQPKIDVCFESLLRPPTSFYAAPSTTSYKLDFSADGTGEMSSRGCFHSWRLKFLWRQKGAEITVSPGYEHEWSPAIASDGRYLLVPWGNQRFLVPVGKIRTFTEVVRRGWNGSSGDGKPSFLRMESRTEWLVGIPRLPYRFAQFLNLPFEPRAFRRAGATWINQGSEDGVGIGLTLMASRMECVVTVDQVEAHAARVKPALAQRALRNWERLEIFPP